MPPFVFEAAPKLICEHGGADRLGEIARSVGITRR